MTARQGARTPAFAAGLLLSLALAACGGGGSGGAAIGSTSPTGSPSGPTASSPAATSPTPIGATPHASAPTSRQPLTLAFAGDVHFEGGAAAALSGGLSAITPALSRADLTVVNLETAVTERGTPAPGKQFTFRAPATAFSALKRAGVDVVTMANNHALDYGPVGLADSLAAARAAGVPVVGAGVDEDAAFAPYIVTVKGRKVAVVGATQVLDSSLAAAWTAGPGKPGLASAKDEQRLVAAVHTSRAAADVVVVDLHWGTELAECPTAAQRSLAQEIARAGADVIVGSHAHVLLGSGWLSDTYVDYGLGNFVFYARTAQTQATGVLTLTVQGHTATASDWTPARITGGLPLPLDGSAAAQASAAKERLRSCTGLSATP